MNAVPPAGSRASEHALLTQLAAMRRHRRSGAAAPNKPATVLWALARLEATDERLVRFSDAEPQLRDLLRSLGAASTNPAYAFWRLAGDGFWEVAPRTGLSFRSGDREPVLPAMRGQVSGGFTKAAYDALSADPSLLASATAVAVELLCESGAGTLQAAAALEAVEMPERRRMAALRVVRDRGFSRSVLRAYEHRCAMCGFSALLGSAHFGVVAAHIQPVAAGGPDTVENGLALCCLHHAAFDAGAISVDHLGNLQCSPRIRGHELHQLLQLSGSRLREPAIDAPKPSAARLAWHRTHVFSALT